MHVLVTGATGTVGRFVVPTLAAAGHRVTTLGRSGDVPWTLDDPAPRLPAAEALVHLALDHRPGAYRGGEGDDPEGFRRRNLDGTLRLFDAAGPARIVFLSSRAVYGDHRRGETLRETDPRPPTRSTGASSSPPSARSARAAPRSEPPVSMAATSGSPSSPPTSAAGRSPPALPPSSTAPTWPTPSCCSSPRPTPVRSTPPTSSSTAPTSWPASGRSPAARTRPRPAPSARPLGPWPATASAPSAGAPAAGLASRPGSPASTSGRTSKQTRNPKGSMRVSQPVDRVTARHDR